MSAGQASPRESLFTQQQATAVLHRAQVLMTLPVSCTEHRCRLPPSPVQKPHAQCVLRQRFAALGDAGDAPRCMPSYAVFWNSHRLPHQRCPLRLTPPEGATAQNHTNQYASLASPCAVCTQSRARPSSVQIGSRWPLRQPKAHCLPRRRGSAAPRGAVGSPARAGRPRCQSPQAAPRPTAASGGTHA